MNRRRYLTLIVEETEEGTKIKCKPLKMEITEGTIGQSFKHFANELRRKTVQELKKALE